MSRYTATVLLVLTALSSTNAFFQLVPKGKELVYSYEGEISAGTNIPKHYASELFVYGKLHLQLEGHGVVAQLSNITYKVYNGQVHHGQEYDLHDIILPHEAHDLLRPFKIGYNSNGQFKSLSMEKEEKMFARNMHRAVAAVLQMDFKKVNFKTNDSHAFSTTEQNLYGKSITEYSVFTDHDTIIVKKLHEMPTTIPIYAQGTTNLDYDYCEANFEEPVFHDSQHTYYIKEKDKNHIAECIETTGSFRMHPYHSHSEDYSVISKVTLNLIDIEPITTSRSRKSDQTEYDVYYRMYDSSTDKNKMDLTTGRHFVDMDRKITDVDNALCQMAIYLHDPLHEKDESINYVLKELEYFDFSAFEKLYSTLHEKSPGACEIFHQILPVVGSHASAVFLKHLIQEKKVTDQEAVQMLSDLPGHLRHPTEDLLKDLKDMLDWDDTICHEVRSSAVLCFSSIMYEIYKAQNQPENTHDESSLDAIGEYKHITNYINGHEEYTSFADRIRSFFKKHDAFHPYLSKFIDMIHKGKDVETQVLGMHALFNTKTPNIIDVFVPIVKAEKDECVLMRVWAIWMIAHVSVGNPEFTYELCWPFLVNYNENPEVRMMAYYVLVESHPTLTRWRNIQHTLEKHRDSDLYYFHYDYLMSMARTTDPCHQVTHLNAEKILKDAPEPLHRGPSHYYQNDFLNTKFKFGEDVNYVYMGAKDGVMLKLEYNLQSANKRYNHYTLYVRIEGLDEKILRDFRVALNSTKGLFNYDHIIELFKSVCYNKDVIIYIHRSSNKRITYSLRLTGSDLTNKDVVLGLLKTIGFNSLDNRIQIRIPEHSIYPFPTELGLPVVLESLSASINRYHVDVKKDDSENYVMHFNNHYYYSNRMGYSLSFYNALADIWQGVGKYHGLEYQFPFFADLIINTGEGNIKLSLKSHEKEYKDAISVKLNVNRQTFVKFDENECLHKSCGHCQRNVETVRDPDFNKKPIKQKIDLHGHLMEYAYDSDSYWSVNAWQEWEQSLSDKKNYNGLLDYLYLSYMNWYRIFVTPPSTVSKKLSFLLTPSSKYINAQTDINARFKETVTQEEGNFLPGVKYDFRVTATTKNKEEVLKTWDAHFITDINCGHTEQYTKLDITRTIPAEKDYKFCIEDDVQWSLEDVTGNSTIILDDPDNHVNDIFNFKYVGKQLPEQKSVNHGYGACLPYVDTGLIDFASVKCLAAHTSIRDYVYEVSAKNDIKHMAGVIDSVINFYNKYYSTLFMKTTNLADNCLNVNIKYPTNDLGADLTYETDHHLHMFKNVPNFITGPSNTHASKFYMFLHEYNFMQKCRANVHTIKTDCYTYEDGVPCELDENWTLYVGDAENECHHGVFLKRIEGTHLMALKTIHGSHSLEVYPCGDHHENFKFIIDGTEYISEMDYYSCDWMTYLHRESNHEVIINTLHFYLNIRFTGDTISIEIPKVDGFNFYGKCFM